MKGFTKALAIGTLIAATQSVAAQSAFPQGADGEPTGLPAQSTYADARANDPVTVTGSAFPIGSLSGERGEGELPAASTYADAHANDPVRTAGSPFPEGADGEPTGLAPLSTYADGFNSEPNRMSGTADLSGE